MQLARQRRHAHHLDDVVARVFVEIGERFGIEAITEDAHQRRRPWRRKTFQKIRLIGRVERRHKGARARSSAPSATAAAMAVSTFGVRP